MKKDKEAKAREKYVNNAIATSLIDHILTSYGFYCDHEKIEKFTKEAFRGRLTRSALQICVNKMKAQIRYLECANAYYIERGECCVKDLNLYYAMQHVFKTIKKTL